PISRHSPAHGPPCRLQGRFPLRWSVRTSLLATRTTALMSGVDIGRVRVCHHPVWGRSELGVHHKVC
ncbi:MAG: hypothetical protein SCH68_12845, partial [Brevefilum sp.]|nr:hypothetical protein [Brevefilum sp.]